MFRFHLLVEHSKSDVFKVGDCWDFFIENNLLGYDVNQVTVLRLYWDIFSKDLVFNFFRKCWFKLLVQDWEITLLVFG